MYREAPTNQTYCNLCDINSHPVPTDAALKTNYALDLLSIFYILSLRVCVVIKLGQTIAQTSSVDPLFCPFSRKTDRIHGINHLKWKITIFFFIFNYSQSILLVLKWANSQYLCCRAISCRFESRQVFFIFSLTFFYHHYLSQLSFLGLSLPCSFICEEF